MTSHGSDASPWPAIVRRHGRGGSDRIARYYQAVSFTTMRMTGGRVLLTAGVLVLLFIPYLLWGTGLITARAQADLRQQFAQAQRAHHDRAALHPPGPTTGPPVVASAIAAPAPGGPVGILSIPKISLSMVVVEGTDADQLRSGPGHYPGTPLPGEEGTRPSPATGPRTSTPSSTSTRWFPVTPSTCSPCRGSSCTT